MCRKLMNGSKLALVLTGIMLVSPSSAYASMETFGYIDPGTGTYIFQIMAAILLGGIVAIKQFWGKIRSFFKRQ